MLAATTKLGLLARFLAVLTAVLSVRTVLWDHALATGVGAFIRVNHERITSRSLYAPEGRITTAEPAGVLGSADFFGEECLAGHSIRKRNATAMTRSTVLIIGKAAMARLLRTER
jgi:CRP-like cAMP-binding protein